MSAFDFVILYVDSPPKSAAFYEQLLGLPPVESSPTFAMFVQPSGIRLGLWSRHTVEPATTSTGGGCCEIAFVTEDVDAAHAGWFARGLTIAQAPVDLDFGRTAVALDPDGHRIRAYTPNGR